MLWRSQNKAINKADFEPLYTRVKLLKNILTVLSNGIEFAIGQP